FGSSTQAGATGQQSWTRYAPPTIRPTRSHRSRGGGGRAARPDRVLARAPAAGGGALESRGGRAAAGGGGVPGHARAPRPGGGADGRGDAVGIDATMQPPPPNILEPPHNWSPYEMFNRATYGGVETAMPSFEQGLTESQRWDIVFYLFAERWPPCEKPLPPIGADELALM